jgi:hypothetical protein
MSLLLTLWPAAAHAACTFRATPERLREALDSAEAAYVSLDVAEFERAMTEVDFVVPCLEATVDPAIAARLHRMRGLGRFAAGDQEGARESLLAARRIEPTYVFTTDVLPPGFELRQVYEQLPVEAGETQRLPRPARDASAWFDGVEARERPVDVPVLWQLRTGDGVQTRYLEPAEAMPWYPGANRDQLPWLVGSAATGVAAGTLLGLARYNHQLVTNPVDGTERFGDEAALEAQQQRTNVLAAVGVGLGTAAVGELVVALWKGGRE